jgi:lipid A 3-O-deacylase
MLSAFKFFAAIGLAVFTQAAFADDTLVDSASLEFGQGARVKMVRVAVQNDWSKEWYKSNGTHLGGYWDFSAAAWRGTAYRDVLGNKQQLVVIGAVPVFRFANDSRKGWFVEGGIGAFLLSELYDNESNRLSTAFQFGDMVGAGYVFDNKWQLAAKIQHFSNGGIKRPNSGVNFAVVKLTRPF